MTKDLSIYRVFGLIPLPPKKHPSQQCLTGDTSKSGYSAHGLTSSKPSFCWSNQAEYLFTVLKNRLLSSHNQILFFNSQRKWMPWILEWEPCLLRSHWETTSCTPVAFTVIISHKRKVQSHKRNYDISVWELLESSVSFIWTDYKNLEHFKSTKCLNSG